MVPFVTVRIVASLISTLPPVLILGRAVRIELGGDVHERREPAWSRAWLSGPAWPRAWLLPSGLASVGLGLLVGFVSGLAFWSGLVSGLDFWSGFASGLAFWSGLRSGFSPSLGGLLAVAGLVGWASCGLRDVGDRTRLFSGRTACSSGRGRSRLAARTAPRRAPGRPSPDPGSGGLISNLSPSTITNLALACSS